MFPLYCIVSDVVNRFKRSITNIGVLPVTKALNSQDCIYESIFLDSSQQGCSSRLLSHLIHLLGEIALRQLIHLDVSVCKELKKRETEKEEDNKKRKKEQEKRRKSKTKVVRINN